MTCLEPYDERTAPAAGVAVCPRPRVDEAAREGVAELVRDTTGLVLSPTTSGGQGLDPRERSGSCRGRGGR